MDTVKKQTLYTNLMDVGTMDVRIVKIQKKYIAGPMKLAKEIMVKHG